MPRHLCFALALAAAVALCRRNDSFASPCRPAMQVPAHQETNAWRGRHKESAPCAVRQLGAALLACIVGLSCAGMAKAESVASAAGPNVATVEAAWGFIKRQFYDRSYGGQDWDAMHGRFLERATKGEAASSITREMAASLHDRWSRIIDASTFEKLMAFDPLGVGLVLTRSEDRQAVVSSPPFAGSSAAKAGLKQGEVVTAIDGEELAKTTLFSAMERVTKADNAAVRLTLQNDEGVRDVTLTRQRAAAPENQVESGAIGATGYLRLRSFGSRSPVEMAAALKELKNKGVEQLVLDLRGNPGGSFQAALEVAGLFLPAGSEASRVLSPNADEPVFLPRGQIETRPMAVLVDGGSASASEVLAAALRGNCRAPLIGEKTFGKAFVQGIFGLPNGEALALSVARYSGPGGKVIGDGLQPDAKGSGFNLARAAAVLGLSAGTSDYASVDVASATASLKSCRPAASW